MLSIVHGYIQSVKRQYLRVDILATYVYNERRLFYSKKGGETLTAFRTKFWELLSEKEKRENKRYTNISDLADAVGITRTTFYKYADEQLTSIDVKVITSLMKFLGLELEDLSRFLILEPSPQLDAQESQSGANGRSSKVLA